jgi:acetyl-CoA C-acetyltransferase
MSHALAAMVRALRAAPGEMGLLYGQGGYVNKHQTLVVGTMPAPGPLSPGFSAQAEADARRGPVPTLAQDYTGAATIETYTVTYDRDGEPLQGVVIGRTPADERVMARVPPDDSTTLALLTSWQRSAVGAPGTLKRDRQGCASWEAG